MAAPPRRSRPGSDGKRRKPCEPPGESGSGLQFSALPAATWSWTSTERSAKPTRTATRAISATRRLENASILRVAVGLTALGMGHATTQAEIPFACAVRDTMPKGPRQTGRRLLRRRRRPARGQSLRRRPVGPLRPHRPSLCQVNFVHLNTQIGGRLSQSYYRPREVDEHLFGPQEYRSPANKGNK